MGQVIKLGTLAPEGSPWHSTLRDMAESWRTLSGGKIQVRIYAGGILGDEPDMVRKMNVGQLQAAALTGAGLKRIAQEVRALEMPMMFASREELEYVRARIEPELNALLNDKGYRILTWGDAGWVYFFTESAVVHPDDLKSFRLFAWAGETAHIDAWKAAGYNPVPLPATEIHTALQTGLVNALITTPVAALSFQWFGMASHMTDLKWAPMVGAVVITSKGWKRIPEQIRPQLMTAARKEGARLQAQLPSFSAKAIDVMVQHGLKVHAVGPEISREWEKRARAGYPMLMGRMVPAEMVARVERLRDEFRRQPAK
jgi:TRAP-type C4-dicarboxylate transport system substrate-binding protein